MKIERLAKKRKVSVSNLVEDHFKTLVRPRVKKSIIELIDELSISKGLYPQGQSGKTLLRRP
jgi:hypothetical protein